MSITTVKLYEIYCQIIINKQQKKLKKKKINEGYKEIYPLVHVTVNSSNINQQDHPSLRTIYVLANETVL